MIKSGIFTAALCAVAASFAAPAVAEDSSETAAAFASFQAYQSKNQRLQDIGRKLAIGNAQYCTNTVPTIGITLMDVRGFARPSQMRQALKWGGDIGVATVTGPHEYYWPHRVVKIITPPVPKVNLEISAIDDQPINAWPAQSTLDWKRLKRVHDAIDASLADNGSVMLTNAAGMAVEAVGTPSCATRFEVKAGGKKALADGARVQFGSEFPGFSYPEEEFAAVIAHELAHNVLEHRIWLDAKGRKRRAVRATEREADRMMPWLIANAGYDPQAAVRFMQRWGPKHSKGIFRARTHDGWDERVEIIAAEAELVEAQMRSNGTADWAQFFRRDIAPLGD